MRYSWRVYLGLCVVAVLSFGAAWFLPTTDILRGVAGSPAIVALIAAVYQILRDQAQHERALSLQRDQQHFILGVTSHMANVVFDKHVKFCEEYLGFLQKVLSQMFAEGPTKDCLKFASDLAVIRLSHRTWLTSEMQEKILPFERALVEIGSSDLVLKAMPVGEKRSETVGKMYALFSKVLALHKDNQIVDEQVAAARIMDHLQDILGVKQLVRLRIVLVDEAVKSLPKQS